MKYLPSRTAGVIFEIRIQKGKRLEDVTLFSTEHEVLLLPESVYCVTGCAIQTSYMRRPLCIQHTCVFMGLHVNRTCAT